MVVRVELEEQVEVLAGLSPSDEALQEVARLTEGVRTPVALVEVKGHNFWASLILRHNNVAYVSYLDLKQGRKDEDHI